jgi:hypothetical protein
VHAPEGVIDPEAFFALYFEPDGSATSTADVPRVGELDGASLEMTSGTAPGLTCKSSGVAHPIAPLSRLAQQ